MMMSSMSIGRRAVVIGAGMAGLTVAGALAEYFERVVILERDALPPDAAPRWGTPQARHAHGLLSGGQRALGDLFPDFEQDLAQAGAVPLRVGLDIRTERPGYDPFPQRDLGRTSYYMSRPLIELVVRRRVAALPNVAFHQQCRALELVATSDGAAVIAVRHESLSGKSETLEADLIVDASGRGSLTFALLQSVRHPLPEKSLIEVDIGYSTAIFEIPNDAPEGWKAVMTLPHAPQSKRRGLMFPIEGDRWLITIGGMHGLKPPGDTDGFLTYLQQLRTPTIYNAVKRAKRLGEIARFGFPASEWRHFERLRSFPRGLLPVGDAYCRFNPVYGQGMSVAAQEAVLIRNSLRARGAKGDPLAALATAFFTGAQALIEGPWAMVESLDFLWPETRGQRPPDFDGISRFGLALMRLAAEDPEVHKLIVEVQHLLKPRSAYRDPDLMRRVQAVMAAA
jgi:2-polyprenyl-6-methoxyphenol hydroxylase-like FAD-dependent oxidoreductase